MARPLRIEFPGAVYHAVSRGNARQTIFADERDHRKFLEILDKTIQRFEWACYAYCLMGNHYHLVIETPEANLSRGMRHLNGTYTQAYHKRYGTVGHLFQGRFKAIIVDKESYLMELVRYVVLNPVRAGITGRPEDWPWSSYGAAANPAGSPPWLRVRPLLDHFSQDEDQAWRQYQAFILAGIGIESPWRHVKSQVLLGDEAFIGRLKPVLKQKEEYREIPKQQRYVSRPSLTEIFGLWKAKANRNQAILQSFKKYGYTQKEIAAFLNVHYTTISHVLKRQDKGISDVTDS